MSTEEETPLVHIGEKIKLNWTDKDGTSKTVRAKVEAITLSTKKKHNTYYKYELSLYKENNATIVTRLKHLLWERRIISAKRDHDEHTGLPKDNAESTTKKQKIEALKYRSFTGKLITF